jgi:hypothetical protein
MGVLYIAHGGMRNAFSILVKARNPLEDLDVSGRIILEWILGK